MEISDSKIKTFAQPDNKKLREHFERRASNPPYDDLPWSGAWMEYVEEMREIEKQLMEAGKCYELSSTLGLGNQINKADMKRLYQ